MRSCLFFERNCERVISSTSFGELGGKLSVQGVVFWVLPRGEGVTIAWTRIVDLDEGALVANVLLG